MSKPGTPPNTSLILTDAELAYINRNFDGSKSAAIHQALGAMMSNDTETIARTRIDNTPELAAHADTILTDWPNWTEHMAWIATAPVSEIVDWAESIENAE